MSSGAGYEDSQAVDATDIHTVVCGVSGALGNAGYFESEPLKFINEFINKATYR